MRDYNHLEIEKKWQNYWQEHQSFKAEDESNKPKYYVLEMLPYPSGKIHMGHVRNYTLGDVIARYKFLQGFNVLHPMGWDAFGLPAENAAIEHKLHPGKWTYENIDSMREQLKTLGFSYDWSREIATCSPDYFKHEQKIFIDFLKAGLAYQKESYVNWDPVDNTVLANEQVIDGKGWRSGAVVERKKLRQWFLKITDFAEELLECIDTKLEGWPEAVKSIQKKWIGRSKGATIHFEIIGTKDKLEVYTTRPDTLFGASFCGISPAHPLALELAEKDAKAKAFIEECNALGTSEEAIECAEKKGFDTGLKVKNPFTEEELPIYIANFILMEYGSGAIFGCPAHDARDHEFAVKYNLKIVPVIEGKEKLEVNKEPYTGEGILINSSFLNDLGTDKAKSRAIEELEKLGIGHEKVNYRLRDWGVSRQRYWGCPIPIIYCQSCGAVPVDEKDLPVKLPEDVSFDSPGNPLDYHPTWKHTNCPTCGKDATRETDTFDTFFESSWYFLRYCTPKSDKPFDKEITDRWMSVDQYIGGIEHAAMHLLYARFFLKALKQCGYTNHSEPFTNLLTQGMVLHATYKDSNGKWLYPEEAKGKSDVQLGRVEKMSKSKKNVVDPYEIINKYGADTARLFMMSDTPPERDLEWSDSGIEGCYKYLKKLWRFVEELANDHYIEEVGEIKDDEALFLRKSIHKTIDLVTNNIEKLHYNNAVANIRELSNSLFAADINNDLLKPVVSEGIRVIILLLSPFVPHIAEEMWARLGNKFPLIQSSWPQAEKELLIENTVNLAVQVNGKLRATIKVDKNLDKQSIEKIALENSNVQKFVEGKPIKKIIIVPGKIVNVVI